MIFAPTMTRAITTGRKTQTRRPATTSTCRYKPGHDYAVQPGRGKPGIARIKILTVREEPVGHITHHDAKAEGFRNTAAFKANWVRLHDHKWIEKQEVTRDGDTIDVDRWMTDADLLTRFDTHHAHKHVWVITFQLADTPIYLASQLDVLTGHTDDGEYTTNRARAIDDTEVIPPNTTDVERARHLAEEQRASFKRDLEAERQRRRNHRVNMLRDAA